MVDIILVMCITAVSRGESYIVPLVYNIYIGLPCMLNERLVRASSTLRIVRIEIMNRIEAPL